MRRRWTVSRGAGGKRRKRRRAERKGGETSWEVEGGGWEAEWEGFHHLLMWKWWKQCEEWDDEED
jgi:hypothetical protein